MKTRNVVAVQLPAPCPLSCSFCRTGKEHGVGNIFKTWLALFMVIIGLRKPIVEVYLTSNGETGLAKGFKLLVKILQARRISVSVLCATSASVVPDLKRVEISWNDFTQSAAKSAITKSKKLGIPIVLSLVDDGRYLGLNLEDFARQFGVQGILVRAQQQEGFATFGAGMSRLWRDDSVDLGCFPVEAYREVANLGDCARVVCINSFGCQVQYLGASV